MLIGYLDYLNGQQAEVFFEEIPTLMQMRALLPQLRPPTMRFYIHSGNHDSQHGIGDTVLFLKNAIQDCGHTACISHTVVPGQSTS